MAKRKQTLAEGVLEAMEEISADARGIPSGVARFSLPPNATPGQAVAAMEAAMDEAEEKLRVHQAKLATEQVQSAMKATGAEADDLAAFFGVSVATVKAWEAGTKTPTGGNRRLLDDMAARPRYWRKKIREAAAALS